MKLLLTLFTTFSFFVSVHAGEPAKPNIVLITADDLNFDSLGCCGAPIKDITPHLDALAREGIRFERAYSTVAVCQPVRQTMLTGLYPHRSGSLGFFPVKPGVRTLNQQMRDAGYLLAMHGKSAHYQPRSQFVLDIVNDGFARDPERLAQAMREVIALAREQNRPFLHFVNCTDPHRPFITGPDNLAQGAPPSRYVQPEEITSVPGFLEDLPDIRKELAHYYTSVRRLDDCVGAVLRVLDEMGVRDDTLVMFYGGDHGMALPFAKTNCYEDSSRGALLLRWPGRIAAGQVDRRHFVSTLDFTPTLLDAAGVPPIPGMDGRSFLPALTGRTMDGWDRVLTFYNQTSGGKWLFMRCLRTTDRSYIWNAWSDGRMTYAAENMGGLSWKAMLAAAATNPDIKARCDFYLYRVPEEFYDMRDDRYERRNLIADPARQSEIAAARAELLAELRRIGDPLAAAFARREDAAFVAAEKEKLAAEYADARSPQGKSAEPTRLYIANDDHTDFMWTADADTYAGVFTDMLDYYLALADATGANPPPYQSRFNCDGSYWLWTYERRKSPEEFQRLIARVKSGHISAPMTALVSCYGAQPAEAVLRGMAYAGQLERRHGLRFRMALSMENQTQPLGLASLWAGAGARYSWKGVCACASRLPDESLARRPHEIYWYEGRDGQRVLMKWYSVAHRVGTYLETGWPINTLTPAPRGGPYEAIDFLDSDPGFLRRYRAPGASEPYRVRGAFGFGGDSLAQKTGVPGDPGVPKEPGVTSNIPGWPQTEHFHDIARKESNAQRQVIVSNEHDFFEDFEKTHGATLPSERVALGNEWDLYSASMSETSARVKRSVEKLRAAELMAALVSLQRPAFLRGREKERDQAFMNLGLYWEHNWTADGPVSRERRAAWQELLATEIETYVNPLHADGATRLGGLIQKPDENAQRFFVLNPLGWSRTAAADFAWTGGTDIHVRDLVTGGDVPHQFVTLDGITMLRILASDVPPAGYKTFEILPGPGSAPTDAAATVSVEDHAVLENSRVRLVVERDGAIGSFIDKANAGADLAGRIDGLQLNDFAANDASGSGIVVENSGPVSVTLKCVSDAGRRHTTRITLCRGSDQIDVRNEITENFRDVRHWAFSFDLAAPDVHTEEVGAVIRVKTRSQGGDYADTHARYDYATLNHFVDITDGANTRGVTLSSPDLAFVRVGHSQPLALDTTTPQLSVLAGGQVDGDRLGIPGQNGATCFLQRFGLRPHAAYDQSDAMKFALEHQNPFVTAAVLGTADAPYPATTYSLLQVSEPGALLWALKVHNDGIEHGLVARLWNQTDQPLPIRLTAATPLGSATRLTHLETAREPLPVESGALPIEIGAQRMETFGFKLTAP